MLPSRSRLQPSLIFPSSSSFISQIFIFLTCSAVVATLMTLTGCGGTASPPPPPPQNPVPTVVSLSPSSTVVGSTSQTLTINGSGFIALSAVTFNNLAHAATFVSSQQLSIVLNQTDLATFGSFPIVVTNPGPGGGPSIPASFRVQGGTLQVQITGLPAGTAANVSISSVAGYKATVQSTQNLQLPPGNYSISANSVSSASLNYYASASQQSVDIADGSTGSVQIPYSIVVANTTKILDQVGMQSMTVSTDGTTLTFPTSSPVASGLSPGDILDVAPTSSAPNGLLRQITSLSQTGSTITAITAQATLGQAFQQANLQISQALTSQNIRSVNATAPGLHVVAKARPTGALIPQIAGITDPCAGSPVTIAETGSLNVPAGFTDTGTLEVCTNFQVNVQMNWVQFQVQTANVSVSLDGQAKLLVEGGYNQGLFNGQTKLAQIEFDPIVGAIGPFPIVLVPQMTFILGANGNITGSLSTAVAVNASVTGGFKFENGNLSPISLLSLSYGYDPLSVDASLTAKVFLQDEIDLLFYGIAGPYFSPDTYLQFSADINQNPWWTLTAGLEGPVGLKADVLGFLNLGNVQLGNVFDKSQLLLHAPGAFSVSAVTPSLSSITPSQAQAGSPGFILAVSGTNFAPGDIVTFNAAALATTFVDPQNLSATVPGVELSNPGTFAIAVSDPNISGSTSNGLPFAVIGTGLNPVPAITSISPSSAPQGSGPITLTASGNGFISLSILSFGSTQLQTAFISSTQLSATVPATALSTQGNFAVTAVNPGPGGGISNPASFTVTAPAATVSISLSPTSVSVPTGGVQTFTAIVSGSSDTAVIWSVAEGALGGTIPSPSVYLAPNSAGTFHVIAAAHANPSIQGTAIVQVTSSLALTVLHVFSGNPDGSQPLAPLMQAVDGNFYGTTATGGTSFFGTVFKMDSSGSVTILHSFSGSDGMNPVAGLAQGSDGNLYGTTHTAGAGYGTVFKIDSSGTLTTLHAFNGTDGAEPNAGLVQATDGYFYGTTILSGQYGGGTVFRIDSNGNFVLLHSFTNCTLSEGCQPSAPLIQGTDGNLYGTTISGGANRFGTVFRITPGGVVTTLHAFAFSDGGDPYGPLFQAKDGFLYGMTVDSPNSNGGEVFKVDLQGNFQVVHAFIGTDGFEPIGGLIQGSDGAFYGICPSGGTSGSGTLFKMNSEGNITVLYSFGYLNGQSSPYAPAGGLIFASDGSLYGVTQAGGTNNSGVAFKLSPALPHSATAQERAFDH